MDKTFDHIKNGKQFKHYTYPPVVTLDINVLDFADGLKGTIPQKLKELLDICDELKRVRDFNLRLYTATTQTDSLEQYFWVSLTFHEFAEYYIVQKWINYWLSLWYRVNPEDLPQTEIIRRLNQINDADIQRAKQTPIQNYYDGQLKRISNRLVGLCLFHQEKIPSFNIYTDTNIYHCYGCQAHGDSISFIKETKNLSFPEAVRLLI